MEFDNEQKVENKQAWTLLEDLEESVQAPTPMMDGPLVAIKTAIIVFIF